MDSKGKDMEAKNWNEELKCGRGARAGGMEGGRERERERERVREAFERTHRRERGSEERGRKGSLEGEVMKGRYVGRMGMAQINTEGRHRVE
jgi:hypothetical protein